MYVAHRNVDEPPTSQSSAGIVWRRFIPIAVLGLGLALFFGLGLDQYVSLSALREHRESLEAFVSVNAILASGIYILIYAVAVAISIPGGAVLTLAGGFLFGFVWGAVLVVVGATLGAVAIFLAARTALHDTLRRRAGTAVQKLEAGFRENAFSYLLTLRLIPIFPFWLVNLVPAFFGVSLGTYSLATVLGIIPGTIVFAGIGNGLGATLEAGPEPDLGLIFQPEILLPILGLALLSLLPVLYKTIKGRRAGAASASGEG